MVDWVKRKTLKWFGRVEIMGSGAFVKVYASESEGSNSRGRPLARSKERIGWRSIWEREVLEEGVCFDKQEGNIGIGRDGGFPAVATP